MDPTSRNPAPNPTDLNQSETTDSKNKSSSTEPQVQVNPIGTYQKIVDSFQSTIEKVRNLVTTLNSQDLEKTHPFYEDRYQALISSGFDPVIAEATTTIEMSQDTKILQAERDKISPIPTSGGTSGSYFIRDRKGQKIGVFKPSDEEVFMPNNPRGKSCQYDPKLPRRFGPRSGHIQGTSWKKEINAHRIGRPLDVPFTSQMKVPFPKTPGSIELVEKTGSFQQFVRGTPVEEMTFRQIKDIPIKEVQKVAILDLILGNSDRNTGNLLYNSESQKLYPIDHGLTMLDSLVSENYSETNCEWINFPQASQPIEPEVRKFIIELNDKIIVEEMTRDNMLSQTEALELKVRIIFVKECINRGLDLSKIAQLCSRENDNSSGTLLEIACKRAEMDVSLEGDMPITNETRYIELFKKNLISELDNMDTQSNVL